MTETAEIVAELARGRVVEEIIGNVSGFRSSLPPDLQDLAQMVYEVLLNYDDRKIKEMHEYGQLRFFIARIITNQFRSSNSPYHRIYRDYNRIFMANGFNDWVFCQMYCD